MKRYHVCCVWGWLEAEPSGRRAAADSQPHVTAEVYDQLSLGPVARYRSEDMHGPRSGRRQRAISAAEAHAATLEREHEREQRQCRPRPRRRRAA